MNRIALRVGVLAVLVVGAVVMWLANMTGSAEDKFAVTAGFVLLMLPGAFYLWLLFLLGEWGWRYQRGERPGPAVAIVLGIAITLMTVLGLLLFRYG